MQASHPMAYINGIALDVNGGRRDRRPEFQRRKT
jgi:hypothetical protein